MLGECRLRALDRALVQQDDFERDDVAVVQLDVAVQQVQPEEAG